jgi:hypothetical protein
MEPLQVEPPAPDHLPSPAEVLDRIEERVLGSEPQYAASPALWGQWASQRMHSLRQDTPVLIEALRAILELNDERSLSALLGADLAEEPYRDLVASVLTRAGFPCR